MRRRIERQRPADVPLGRVPVVIDDCRDCAECGMRLRVVGVQLDGAASGRCGLLQQIADHCRFSTLGYQADTTLCDSCKRWSEGGIDGYSAIKTLQALFEGRGIVLVPEI